MTSANRERASAYLKMARCYAEAAKRLSEGRVDDHCRLPFFMLIAHALELSFKVALIQAGWDEERLIGVGHDLCWCYDLARKEDPVRFDGDPALDRLAEALHAPHHYQAFRYPQPFRWALPEPQEAVAVLDRLLTALGVADQKEALAALAEETEALIRDYGL